jgi:hypothetical protein
VRLAPATAVRLVVTNLLLGRQPLYGLGEWAARFAPGQLGLAAGRGRRQLGWPGGQSALSRLAIRSATTIVGRLVFTAGIVSMTDASAT